jgi:uncharacterized membrane protein
MITVEWVITCLILTIVLERVFYITGVSAITYYWTDRRLKGFPNYKMQNRLFHAKLLNATSRVVPAPTPHALNSSCIYNVKEKSIRLKAVVPEGVYWSITFFGRNQACYFTLNDMEAKERYGNEVEIILTKSKSAYQPVGNEIIVEAPRLSRIGLILIRTVVMDPSAKNSLSEAREIQKKAFTEELNGK